MGKLLEKYNYRVVLYYPQFRQTLIELRSTCTNDPLEWEPALLDIDNVSAANPAKVKEALGARNPHYWLRDVITLAEVPYEKDSCGIIINHIK